MASFLQNNGDIILDAVLTDYGRKLLAKGDGSFNIVKFAFGDDEIDYGLYDKSLQTGQKDIKIMETPILEAFTNNGASMKSQLLTIGIENLLFLPVLKLNDKLNDSKSGSFNDKFNGFVVPVNVNENATKTSNSLTGSDSNSLDGVLSSNTYITIDQGIDSPKFSKTTKLKDEYSELYESEYNIFVDNRFCSVSGIGDPISVDDDNIAVYNITDQTLVNSTPLLTQIQYNPNSDGQFPIRGAQGSRLKFTITPNSNLQVDTYFDKYGKQLELVQSTNFKTLRMPVRVVGVTTGYSIEIPVMFAKVVS